MIDYGCRPKEDEIEITLFGPGYGEAVVVHLGNDNWLLVDSCIDPDTSMPASETYLDFIGVDSSCIRTIVASHWHDDHVRGLSNLVVKYSDANFIISAVFNEKELLTFATAYGGGSSPRLTGGMKELFLACDAKDEILYALHRTIVSDDDDVLVTALSPMSGAFSQSIINFSKYLPERGDSINHAPDIKPNLEAVALHIDFGDDAILLGSDLEDHKEFGWTAVSTDKWSGKRRLATAYKVAHHGSKSGDCQNLWTHLLDEKSVACLTPWTLAGNRLPTEDDKLRVKKNSSQAYISSESSSRPQMDSSQLKRLKDIAKNVKLANSGFGAIRLRKKVGMESWKVELFGAAQKL